MQKTGLTSLMATLCLNFSYAQLNEKCPSQSNLQLYKYGFRGFAAGYKPGYKIKRDILVDGKTITIRNYTVTQLFAITLGKGKSIRQQDIIIEVEHPEKLNEIYCYRLIVPGNDMDHFFMVMNENMNLQFPDYLVTIEERDRKRLMLIRDRD